MKIRSGFVSNSSSSSFVIAYDKSVKLDKNFFLEVIGAGKENKGFVGELVKGTVKFMEECDRETFKTMKEVIDEYGSCEADVPDSIREAIKKGWIVTFLQFNSEGEGFEPLLCDHFSCDVKTSKYWCLCEGR